MALNKVFMGVDWGTGENSYTVVTICTMNDDNQFQMLYCKKYDTGEEMEIEYQLEHIGHLMNKYKIT